MAGKRRSSGFEPLLLIHWLRLGCLPTVCDSPVDGGFAIKTLVFGVIFLGVVLALALHQTAFARSRNLKLALITWRGETEGEKGFKDGLRALGYSVGYTTMTAGQDRKELSRLLRVAVRAEKLTILTKFILLK